MNRWEISKVCSGNSIMPFILSLERPIAVFVFGEETDLKNRVVRDLRKEFETLDDKSVLVSIGTGLNKTIRDRQDGKDGYNCLMFDYASVVGIHVKSGLEVDGNLEKSEFCPKFRGGSVQTRAVGGIDWLITVENTNLQE